MKSGLYIGYKETIEVTVTEEMIASFGGVIVHPVLSTVSMVYHMEWVSRKVILPFLHEYEEGIGAELAIKHIAPASVGKLVIYTAEITELTDKKVVCKTLAQHDKGIVGEGSFTQIILPKIIINKNILLMN